MNDNIGIMIKKTRESKKITKEELAERLGVKVTTITKWEMNIGKPSFSYLLLLSKELGLSIDEIIVGHSITNKNKRDSDKEFEEVVRRNLKYKNYFNVFAGIFVCLCLFFLGVVLYKNDVFGNTANYVFMLVIFMIYFVAVSQVVERSNLLEEKNKYRDYYMFMIVCFALSLIGFALIVLK